MNREQHLRLHEQLRSEWDALDPNSRPDWFTYYAQNLEEHLAKEDAR